MNGWMAALACAVALGARAGKTEDIPGDWRGALAKGAMRTVADVHFAEENGALRGTFWAGGPDSTPLSAIRVDARRIQFEVPGIATFDGMLEGGSIRGTFHDAVGEGTFAIEKQPAFADPVIAP